MQFANCSRLRQSMMPLQFDYLSLGDVGIVSPRSGASFARSNMIHSQIQNPSPTLPLWRQNSANSCLSTCAPRPSSAPENPFCHAWLQATTPQGQRVSFFRGNKEGTCSVCFPCFEWPDFSEVKRGKIKVLLEFGWGKRNLSCEKMCAP